MRRNRRTGIFCGRHPETYGPCGVNVDCQGIFFFSSPRILATCSWSGGGRLRLSGDLPRRVPGDRSCQKDSRLGFHSSHGRVYLAYASAVDPESPDGLRMFRGGCASYSFPVVSEECDIVRADSRSLSSLQGIRQAEEEQIHHIRIDRSRSNILRDLLSHVHSDAGTHSFQSFFQTGGGGGDSG